MATFLQQEPLEVFWLLPNPCSLPRHLTVLTTYKNRQTKVSTHTYRVIMRICHLVIFSLNLPFLYVFNGLIFLDLRARVLHRLQDHWPYGDWSRNTLTSRRRDNWDSVWVNKNNILIQSVCNTINLIVLIMNTVDVSEEYENIYSGKIKFSCLILLVTSHPSSW